MNNLKDMILLVAETTATVLTIAIAVRVVFGPDGTKSLIMKASSIGEDFCQRNAEAWAGMAYRCERVYNGARSVTV